MGHGNNICIKISTFLLDFTPLPRDRGLCHRFRRRIYSLLAHSTVDVRVETLVLGRADGGIAIPVFLTHSHQNSRTHPYLQLPKANE
jgi:hypothetical protein